MANQRPSLFIGSSTEGQLVAQEVASKLENYVESTMWGDGFFNLGMGTLESLTNQLDKFDFAIFVLSPDDTLETRGQNYASPRDNVLFELGLFMGSLGRSRTFIVYAAGKDLKLPSDLAGITMTSYHTRQDQTLASALNQTCLPIIRAILSLGLRESRKTEDLMSPKRLHRYRCPESEKSAKEMGTFKECASRSTSAKYLVIRGRDILSSEGEIAHLIRNPGPLLELKLLMVDFETLSKEKFHEIRQTMDLKWPKDLDIEREFDAERQMAKEKLAFARELSTRRSGFQYRLLPSDMVPEIKLRLYNRVGFFTFYRKNVGFSAEVQNRPIFCVEDQEWFDHSPLRTTLDLWFNELWSLSRLPS